MQRTILCCFLLTGLLASGGSAQTTFPSLSAEGTFGAVRIGNVNTAPAQVTPGAGGTLVATLAHEGTTPHPDGWSLLTVVTGSATAGYGTLSGSVSTLAEDKPEQLTTPLGSTLVNRTSCEANGFLSVRFNDTAVVTSSTLPAGTAVTLTITLALESLGVGSSSPSPSGFATPPYGMNAIGHFQIGGGTVRDFFHGITTFTVATQVGATLQFSGWLDVAAEVHGGWDVAAGVFYTKAEASIDASRTAHFYLDAPYGVTLQTGSGHNYASAPPAAGRIVNLSTRGLAQTGDNVLIPGFVISGTANKRLLIRAVGPSLATHFDVAGTLPNPRMVLKRHDGNAWVDVATNDDWQTNANAAAITQTAADAFAFAFADEREAALLLDLGPGLYTAIVDGAGGLTGVVLAELYDVDPAGVDSRLVNISTRGFVGPGDQVMIPGFVISSESARTLLVRVVGPSLVGGPPPGSNLLLDPKLEVYRQENGTNTLVTTQDNWSDDPNAATTAQVAQQLGAFTLPAGSKDAAFVITLQPGVYSVVGSSAIDPALPGGTGVVLVEVYLVP